MMHRSQIWAVTTEQMLQLKFTERRMLRYVSGKLLRKMMSAVELRKFMNVKPIVVVLRRGRLRWSGHIFLKSDENLVKKSNVL